LQAPPLALGGSPFRVAQVYVRRCALARAQRPARLFLQQLLNTRGASASLMQEKVMTTDTITLHYDATRTRFDAIKMDGEIWLRVSQIDAPLGFSHPNQVTRLYNRHRDEFGPDETRLIVEETAGGPQMVRVFSRRGCLLLCMLARTEPAKAFRRWLLDLLQGRVTTGPAFSHGPTVIIDPASAPLVQAALERLREAAAVQAAAKRQADAIRLEARRLARGADCPADALTLLWNRERRALKRSAQPELPLSEG
jgi:prophage antirepressor-like protein